jgi:energy-coupling factor transporter transmembrane protein EcfT
MEIIALFIALLVAAWVFSDAKSRGKENGIAFLWFLGVFFLLIIFLPLWFIFRPKKDSEIVILDKPKLCQECGKYYEGLPTFCPNCGKPVQERRGA